MGKIVVLGVIVLFAWSLYKPMRNDNYIDTVNYPKGACDWIIDNLDYKNIKLFNEYNYGSYLLLNDIPVFIDSRADLYTKQFSGFDYDIFDDFEFMMGSYQEKFEFYKITHVITRKEDSNFYTILNNDKNYKILYEDDNFAVYEKIGTSTVFINITK